MNTPTEHAAQGWLAEQPADKLAEAVERMRERAASGPTNYLEQAAGDPYFALFLHLCDVKCQRAVGFGIFDISDYAWHDAYTSGENPAAVVREALENDDTFSALFG